MMTARPYLYMYVEDGYFRSRPTVVDLVVMVVKSPFLKMDNIGLLVRKS